MCLLEMVNLRKSTFNVNLSRAETIPLKNSSRFNKGKIPIKGPIKRATRIPCLTNTKLGRNLTAC